MKGEEDMVLKVPSPRWIMFMMNRWGPWLGAGIRATEFSPDARRLVLKMRLRWYNRNWVGTHYGGSLFSMSEMYMVMLLKAIGPEYKVWDRAASIEYVKPGRGEVVARYELTDERMREIAERTRDGRPHNAEFRVDVTDSEGEVVARINRTVYVRRKRTKTEE